jgi:hypothetical protein
MNLEQAGHFIRQPQELDITHAGALKQLAARHPYSSVYALLYLASLSNGKSPDLDDALAAHAYRLSDRTRLYHLLTSGSAPVADKEVRSDSVSERISAQTQEAAADTNVEIRPEVDAPSDQQAEDDHAVSEPETDNETSDEAHERDEAVGRKSEAEIGFDFERVTTAHSMEQFVEVGAETNVGAETSLGMEAVPSETEEQNERGSVEAENIPAETNPDIKDIPAETDQRKSFTSWLKSSRSVPLQAVQPIAEKQQPEEPKPDPNALIEKFIREEPTITRNKTEFFSPSKKAKESLSEDAVPVSETLAKIYAAQGNYPKAIHVYHQLMLSVPEKKSLFAVRIEELKKKITQ